MVTKGGCGVSGDKGESDRERIQRLAREQREARYERMADEVVERLKRQAAEEEAQAQRDAKLDDAFEKDLTRYLGLDSYADVQRTMRELLNDPDSEISKVAQKYTKASKRGRKQAAKVAKQNKAVIKKAVKKKKAANSGCGKKAAALLLIAGTSATLVIIAMWNAIEFIAALAK